MSLHAHYRKLAIKSANICAIVCAVIIAIFIVVAGSGMKGIIFGAKKIKSDANLKDYKNQYVEIEVKNVMSEYLRVKTTTKNKSGATVSSKITAIGYLILDTDKDYEFTKETYYGIVLPAKEEKSMDKRMDDFWNFMAGGTDKAPSTLKVKGSVREITGQELNYYNKTMKEIDKEINGGWPFDNAQIYTIDTRNIGSVSSSLAWMCLIGALITAAVAIIYYIIAALGYDNAFQKFLKAHPQYSAEYMDSEFQRAERIDKNIFVGSRFLFFRNGTKFNCVDFGEQVWAYYYKRTGKNAVFEMRYYDTNRKLTHVPASESLGHAVLEKVNNAQPHVVVGYTKELEQMFNRDFGAFMNLRFFPAKNAAQYAAQAQPEAGETSFDTTDTNTME